MFDRLMCRTVFAQADRVVRVDEDRTKLHQCGHADGVAGVVRECEERAAVGNEAAIKRNAVLDGAHAELANAVADVSTAHIVVRQTLNTGPVGEIGTGQIGRAAQQFGQRRCKSVERLLACFAGGHRFGSGSRSTKRVHHRFVKARGQVAGETALEFGGQFRVSLFVLGKECFPFALHAAAGFAGIHRRIDFLRHFKGRIVPADVGAGGRDFVAPERFAVSFGRAGAIGTALTNDGAADDQRGLGGFGFGLRQSDIHRFSVMAVNRTDHIPAVCFKAAAYVVAVPPLDVAVNTDAVVVVYCNELVESPDAGKRTDFVADAFHHAAVAKEAIGAVVDDFKSVAVEFRGEHLFGKRHADGVGNALTERTGRGFHPRRNADFGVARRFAPELAEILDIFDGNVIARQMQHRVLQHGAVAVGKNEAVACRPLGISRIVAQMSREQRHGDVGHAHGHAGVAGLGAFNRVHGKSADSGGHRLGGDCFGHFYVG